MSRDELVLAAAFGADWPAEVAIGGLVYQVRAASEGYEVRNRDGDIYTVGLDGGRSCTCPDYQYRGRGEDEDCKHARALRTNGLLPPERPGRQVGKRGASFE